jgi:multidrug efflux pump subunit AcrA (membrane-fusion protein)
MPEFQTSPQRSHGRRHGLGTAPVIALVAIIGTALLVLLAVLPGNVTGGGVSDSDLYRVTRAGFDIVVPVSGHLEAEKQVEIRNPLEEAATITEIVPEGSSVKAGDIVVRLADERVRKTVEDIDAQVIRGRNSLQSAQAGLEIAKGEHTSQLAQADLQIRLSEIAYKAWEEGEVVSKRDELTTALETAQKEFKRLRDKHEKSISLQAQDFISKDELDQDEIAMIRAESELRRSRINLDVYEQYTHEQDREKYESDRTRAKEEKTRLQTRLDAELTSSKSGLQSATEDLEQLEMRLARYKDLLEKCLIAAPFDGLVVYATSIDNNRGDDRLQIGSQVWPNQLIIALPQISKMIAKVKINEALSGLVQQGQRVTVTADAVPNSMINGTVATVGILAEGGGWRDPNRRDYTIRVELEDAGELELKPSMRCRAEIFVGRVDDALFVPIPAVFHRSGQAFIYSKDGSTWRQQPVTLGQASEFFVEITDGIEEEEIVLLREPSADLISERIEE